MEVAGIEPAVAQVGIRPLNQSTPISTFELLTKNPLDNQPV